MIALNSLGKPSQQSTGLLYHVIIGSKLPILVCTLTELLHQRGERVLAYLTPGCYTGIPRNQ